MRDLYKIWHGGEDKYIDEIFLEDFKDIAIGCYGGSSLKGAYKNEDGYIVIRPSKDSVFTILFDAHTTSSSLEYLIEKLSERIEKVMNICNKPVEVAFQELQKYLLNFIQSDQVKLDCKSLTGEASVLFCFQKEEFLLWLSIGDNSLYIFHKDFNDLGQYRINQRIFYQWIGQQNAVGLKVPCYSSGTIQLRKGVNKILLLTDGVLEVEGRVFENSSILAEIYSDNNVKKSTEIILNKVKSLEGQDNATMISWSAICNHVPLSPSRLFEYE